MKNIIRIGEPCVLYSATRDVFVAVLRSMKIEQSKNRREATVEASDALTPFPGTGGS